MHACTYKRANDELKIPKQSHLNSRKSKQPKEEIEVTRVHNSDVVMHGKREPEKKKDKGKKKG